MLKPLTQQLHEQFGGAVIGPTLPEPDYPAPFFPVPNDTANFGPRVAQTTFGPAEEAARHEDAVLDTVSIQTLLGRCLSRLSKLQGLEWVEDAEQRLSPLRDALGAAFGAAEVEAQLMAEFEQSADEQHEEVLESGKKQSAKLAKLREGLVAADVNFENCNEALMAAQRELKIRRSEKLDRWAGKKEIAARQKELDAVQKRIDALRAETAQAAQAFKDKQQEVEGAQAELVEIDRAERRLRAIVEGNRFAVDPELGLSPGTGVEPMIRA